MKLSKNLGRIATTFLATAMLAGLTAVPASAATISDGTDGQKGTIDVDQSSTPDGIDSISFKTQLLLPANVPVPSASYSFTLAPATPTTEELTGKVTETVSGIDGAEIPVQEGKGSSIPSNTVTFVAGEEKTALTANDVIDGSQLDQVSDIQKVVKDVTFNLDASVFDDAGVYKYTLHQNDITSSESSEFVTGKDKTVYLYVERTNADSTDAAADDTYVVTGVVLKNGTTGTDKTAVFNNAYKLNITDPDKPIDPTDPPEATANELMVNNTVKGVMGNKSELFTYTIAIKAADNKTFNAKYEHKTSASGSWIEGSNVSKTENITFTKAGTVNDDGTYTYTATVQLAHNEQVHIYGLSNGDKYTVAQTAPTNEGYNMSVAGGSNNSETKFATENVTMAYTNTRNAIAPTGLVMNVAPYVLLVLVAAGAGYVFLRKREED